MSTPNGPYPDPSTGSFATGSFATGAGAFGQPGFQPQRAPMNVGIIGGWIFAGITLLVGLILFLTAGGDSGGGYGYSEVESAIGAVQESLIGLVLMLVGLVAVAINLAAYAVVTQVKRGQ